MAICNRSQVALLAGKHNCFLFPLLQRWCSWRNCLSDTIKSMVKTAAFTVFTMARKLTASQMLGRVLGFEPSSSDDSELSKVDDFPLPTELSDEDPLSPLQSHASGQASPSSSRHTPSFKDCARGIYMLRVFQA